MDAPELRGIGPTFLKQRRVLSFRNYAQTDRIFKRGPNCSALNRTTLAIFANSGAITSDKSDCAAERMERKNCYVIVISINLR
jgi:hypothetical protein